MIPFIYKSIAFKNENINAFVFIFKQYDPVFVREIRKSKKKSSIRNY